MIGDESGIVELCQQIPLEFGARDPAAFVLHVAQEAVDHPLRLRLCGCKGRPQIEQITSLLSLVQRPHLCAQ